MCDCSQRTKRNKFLNQPGWGPNHAAPKHSQPMNVPQPRLIRNNTVHLSHQEGQVHDHVLFSMSRKWVLHVLLPGISSSFPSRPGFPACTCYPWLGRAQRKARELEEREKLEEGRAPLRDPGAAAWEPSEHSCYYGGGGGWRRSSLGAWKKQLEKNQLQAPTGGAGSRKRGGGGGRGRMELRKGRDTQEGGRGSAQSRKEQVSPSVLGTLGF